MKFILALTLVFAAQAQTAKPSKAAKARPAASTPAKSKAAAPRMVQPLEIPKNAVEYEPGSFRATDAAGKKWIYRKTPFGVARLEDKPVIAPPDPAAALVKATDAGDVIRFERPGPFGTYRWERKKTELNESEKAAWERSRNAKQD